MLRLRNLSCFIVPVDVRHAIFHLFVMQSACMLAHIIMSAPLLLPPPLTPFGLFILKIKSRFMSMERHGRQREENLLTKRLVTIVTTFYCKPGVSLLKELHFWFWKVGKNVPNLRRLPNIKVFSAVQIDTDERLSCIPSSCLHCGMSTGRWGGAMGGLFRKDTET